MNASELRQTISQPDTITERILEARDEIDLAAFVGKPHSITFTGSDGKEVRRHGLVALARQEETTIRSTGCTLEARSWFHLLHGLPACAVYQNMSVPEIVKKAAAEQGFVDIREALGKTPAKREYTVQYNESTFAFLSRIMAEDGIFYYFRHDGEKHTMVLADGKTGLYSLPALIWRAANTPETPDRVVWDLRPERRAVAAAAAADDYNYLTPSTSLLANKGKGAPSYHANGSRHQTHEAGETVAGRRLASLQREGVVLRGRTAAAEMAVGGIFTITGCPAKSLNADWAVVGMDLRVDEYGKLEAAFVAVPPDAVAPPVPARPRVAGPMTGVVCGAAGDEIATDAHGRIKVRFHWDRRGKADDTASCWLRVMQPWAGGGYGALFLPRVGQEVLVDFIDGDPDRPVVVGCLYNAANRPPWQLPDNAAVSGVKGRATPRGDICNEISLDDKKDHERLYFHAQKLLECLIEDERKVRIVGDGGDSLTIDKASRTVEIKQGNDSLTLGEGSRAASIEKGGDTLVLGEGSREVSIKKGDDKLAVKGKRTLVVDGDYDITVGGDLTIKVDGKIILQSQNSTVRLESKTAFDIVSGSSLSASAKTGLDLAAGTSLECKAKTGATVDGGTQLDLKGAMFSVKASATGSVDGGGMLNVKGAMVKIN